MDEDQQCRLCASLEEPFINIFSVTGLKHKLYEKITQRLQLPLTRDDPLPKSICIQCCGRLDIYDQYVRGVHDTYNKLLKQAVSELRSNRVLKDENVVDTIEIYDDAPSSFDYEMADDNRTNQGDNHVSVIKYQLNSANENTIDDQTRRLNISPKSKEIVYKYNHTNGQPNDSVESTNYAQNDTMHEELENITNEEGKSSVSRQETSTPLVKRLVQLETRQLTAERTSSNLSQSGRILRSNPESHFSRRKSASVGTSSASATDGTFKEMKLPERRRSVFQKVEKTDFSAQIGNTLHSDLVALKNSLLLRRVSVQNARVLTIPIPVLPNVGNTINTKKTFVDSATSKGCQTEILLGAKSDAANVTVYQKISFENRPLLEIGSEKNAIISSPLPLSR